MHPERGQIVLIPFPFSDLTKSKRRPVLALSGPDRHGDFVCLAVTSRPQGDPAIAVPAAANLPRPSWIRTDKVFTLAAGLAAAHLAEVDAATLDTALARLCVTLGGRPAPPL